jgi:ankyrin repeat protein
MVSPFEARALAVIRELPPDSAGGTGEEGYRFSGAHLTLGFSSTVSRPAGTPIPSSAGTLSIVNAVFNGQEYLLRARLAAGADPDEKDIRGYTALLLAARLRHWLMVADLLAAGASPNPRDAEGRTPLHHAAFAGNEAAVRALLKAGADRGIADLGGLKPADLAADRTIKALLR